HSIDEHYAAYREVRLTARKPHECDACELLIRKGDRYTRIGIVFQGSAETVCRCLRCQFIHEHLREKGGASGMWPAERLDCGETYQDHWDEEPPAFLAALAFWQPGQPLPAVEPCSPLDIYGTPNACAQWGRSGWRAGFAACMRDRSWS